MPGPERATYEAGPTGFVLTRGPEAAGITVDQSDSRRAPGRLSRQEPPALRWTLFEAAKCARRSSSPDHLYYVEAATRLGSNRAWLAIARKLLKRSYHTLRELGEEAVQPALGPSCMPSPSSH